MGIPHCVAERGADQEVIPLGVQVIGLSPKLGGYFGVMFGLSGNAFSDPQLSITFMNNLFWLIAAVLFCMPITQLVKRWTQAQRSEGVCAGISIVNAIMNVMLLFVCTAMLVGDSYNPFLYFRF